jgi:hypothetical protein
MLLRVVEGRFVFDVRSFADPSQGMREKFACHCCFGFMFLRGITSVKLKRVNSGTKLGKHSVIVLKCGQDPRR